MMGKRDMVSGGYTDQKDKVQATTDNSILGRWIG
jgi:hypothetical protein